MRKLISMSEYVGWVSIKDLNDLVKHKESEGYSDFHLGTNHYDSSEIELCYSRLETDEEYEKRTAKEKKETEKKQKAIISKKEKNRALYEKLKAEFGE